jgi:hypothetical protein
LVYADDVHLLGKNMNIIKKNTEALLNVSKDVGLEVNTEKKVHIHASSPDYRKKIIIKMQLIKPLKM